MSQSWTSVVGTARALAADSMAVEVVTGLRAKGIDAVVLKGPSIAQWLYASGPARPYADVDVLADPRRLADAEGVLRDLGFEPSGADDWPGSQYQPHARAWLRTRDAAVVDLHRTLPGLRGIGPEDGWAILRDHRDELRAGGGVLPVLDVPARLVLLALHAHHHLEAGQAGDRPLEDLRRALNVVDDAAWVEAAELSSTLNALPAFASGLQAVPDGEAQARRLPLLDTTLAAAASDDPLAHGIARLFEAKGLRARMSIAMRELAPSPSYLRYSSRLARRGRAGLAAAYVRRALWLLRRLPPGYRAWRRAR